MGKYVLFLVPLEGQWDLPERIAGVLAGAWIPRLGRPGQAGRPAGCAWHAGPVHLPGPAECLHALL